jgi:L-fucose isomerase-like protein
MSEEIETLTLEELERRIKQGNYPKGTLKRYQEKLEEELREEKGQQTPSESILHFYSDSARNHEVIVNPNTGRMNVGTFTDYLHLYLFNDSEEAFISDIKFVFEDKDLTVVQVPLELKPKEMGALTLNFHPSRQRALKTTMKVSYSIIFKPVVD